MKKQLIVIVLTALAILSAVSCSDSDTSSTGAAPADLSASEASSESSEAELSSDRDSDTSSQPDESDASSQTDEKTYTITAAYDNSWEISDKETLDRIDEWLEKVGAVCEDYALEDDDYPKVGGTYGYIIKTDGDNYEKMYFVTTTRLDLGEEYEHQNNFSVNHKPYELPWEYIDEIEGILAPIDPKAKTYTITESYENSWDITDRDIIAEIDTWLGEVLYICEDYRLEDDDYPMVGGTEGFIIKTDGDNYEKMYFVTTTRLDLGEEYEHQDNFSVNQKSYELPWEYIDRISEIIENSKE
ncbi:hypothetical protein [Ruminococcus sp. Marseille-P6503]|uniref:hypothetical protein n=1 Tax=Ruminococcus sp. Marseille-P6503 TaxID=2364796 RepID=UPI000F529B96|nr:hypothetical protein [Ruminococcus sp. Marseille-P6503]